MQVHEIMSRDPVTISDSITVGEAHALMRRRHIRALPVVCGGRVVGIVTDRDLRTARALAPSLASAMTDADAQLIRALVGLHGELIAVAPSDPVRAVAETLRERRIGGAPVLEDDRLVGVITVTDLMGVLVALLDGKRSQRPNESIRSVR